MDAEPPSRDQAREQARERRARVHAALADRHRLGIVDELALSDRSPSELAERLGIGSNLLAHHVRVLLSAGILERLGSAGDRRRRYLRLDPSAIAATLAPAEALVARGVLFVCSANSARSQLAAALWNARHGVRAQSAGTRPAPRIHPLAIRAADHAGVDLRGASPRSLADVEGHPDLVVTVCDLAHEELGVVDGATALHWSIPDPAESGRASAFEDAALALAGRIEMLAPRVHPGTGGPRPKRRTTR
jgi:protein-tyrosine-phosphatase/DNA-binding HxlR family transcriptional regulator